MPADAASSKARDWVRHRQTNDDLERLHQWQRRNRSLLFTAGEGGMITGIAKFDRVSGAQFQNLVEALADRLYRADGGRDNPHARTRPQCRHDALLALVGLEPATPPPAGNSAPSSNPGDSNASDSAPSSNPGDSNASDSAPSSNPGDSNASNSAPSSNPGDPTTANSACPSDPAVGREAGNGRASPGLSVPRPTPLSEFASGGPTPGSSGASAGSVPNTDVGDSGTGGSGLSSHRPVLEVAGHGRASPRLSTPHQELPPDPASCSLPGTVPNARPRHNLRSQPRFQRWPRRRHRPALRFGRLQRRQLRPALRFGRLQRRQLRPALRRLRPALRFGRLQRQLRRLGPGRPPPGPRGCRSRQGESEARHFPPGVAVRPCRLLSPRHRP